MSYGIIFNNEGSWNGKGKFPIALKDMTIMSKWVIRFFQEFNQIGNKYSKYIANDGTLLGQEKVGLVKELDDVIGGLLLFRGFIANEIEGKIISLDNKFGYTFMFSYNSLGWDGSGKIMNKYVFNIKNFYDWYKAMMQKLKETFSNYLNSLKDMILDDIEINNLYLLIDFIIFDIIVIEKKLITTGINK